MKKKTLIILLIIPFIISLITFVSVTIMTNSVLADISDISWKYAFNQGFKIQEEGYRLDAKAVYDENLTLAPGNSLIWFAKEEDGSSTDVVSIEKEGENYYLYALKEGECQVVCQNERGTVSKYFNAHIYENGAIIINPKREGSLSNIDNQVYYGQYDLIYSELKLDSALSVEAKFEVVPTLLDGDSEIFATNLTDNVSIDNNIITIKGYGDASIRFYTTSAPIVSSYFNFKIIKDGHNVFNYNDLLMCTNFSSKGKVVVLQSHLESLQNVYRKDNNNRFIDKKLEGKESYNIFGNFDFSKQKFAFENELAILPSSYNVNYINQANKNLDKEQQLAPNIKVGINVKKDFYGNGFTINGHGLAYPNHGKIEVNGKLTPKQGDYFFGPLPFVTIGSLKDNSVVKAYGQDNALMYINNDNIIINDIKIRNTNEINNMYNLIYTGSVIDVNGYNNTIKNSIISNGRNAVRAFSCNGLTISNSILKNAAQFLLDVGSNEYNSYDLNKEVEVTFEGTDYSNDFETLFSFDNPSGADAFINQVITSNLDNTNKIDHIIKTFNQLQAGLDNLGGMVDENNRVIYKDVINLNKVLFSNSGIFSIAFESMFNGPYLYNGTPTGIHSFLDMFSAILPNKISGTSYPVLVNVSDDCKFYDWKNIDSIDTSVLIEENISSVIKQLFGKEFELTMEDYFPMKSLLKDELTNKNYFFNHEGNKYINSKVAWYGGGLNLSSINFVNEDLGDKLNINLLRSVLENKYISNHDYVRLLAKCVNFATGSHPFNFLTNGEVIKTPEEFNKVPQIEDLK